MIAWLATKGIAGLARWAWLLIVAAIVLGAVLLARSAEKADDRQNQQIGAQGAVVAGQAQTLEQAGDAQRAEQELEAAGERSSVRYADCLRNARTKSRCERYNPNSQPVEPLSN